MSDYNIYNESFQLGEKYKLMYNKESCKACGSRLTAVSLCVICSEQVSWLCRKCERSYDVTHTHAEESLNEY